MNADRVHDLFSSIAATNPKRFAELLEYFREEQDTALKDLVRATDTVDIFRLQGRGQQVEKILSDIDRAIYGAKHYPEAQNPIA